MKREILQIVAATTEKFTDKHKRSHCSEKESTFLFENKPYRSLNRAAQRATD
jgi:hypothetical protein